MSGKKLLVADDSLTIQKVIRLALSNEGYEIQTVSDGNDATQQIAVFRPDIVLIDISLPKKNAFEVKQITEAHEGLGKVRFVVMLSAFEKVDQSKIDSANFHGKLTKPFDPAHLREVLNQVLVSVPAAEPAPTVAPNVQTIAPPIPGPTLQVPSEPEAEIPLAPPPIPDWGPLELTPPPISSANMPSANSEEISSTDLPPLPTMEPPSGLPSMDLWGPTPTAPSLTPTPPPTPASAPASPSEGDSDSDIRHLTESTIRMSGLDDFQWSVNEPVIKPTPNMLDRGGSNFSFEPPELAQPTRPPQQKPSLSLPPMPTHIPGLETYQEEYAPPPPSNYSSLPPYSSSAATAPPATFAAPAAPTVSPISPISKEEIEAMIQKQVSKILEEMAQKILPDVAERIIKEEIHRLLSEKP